MTTIPPDRLEQLFEAIDSLRTPYRELLKAHQEATAERRAMTEGIQALTSRIDGLEGKVDGLEVKFDGVRDDLAMVKGGHAMSAMRHNVVRIADAFDLDYISEMPQAAIIGFAKVARDKGEPENQVEIFRNADAVLNIVDSQGNPGYLAIEASFTVGANDVRRAARNAGYLKEYTGLPTYAAVVGVDVLDDAQLEIDSGGALLYRIPARLLQSE